MDSDFSGCADFTQITDYSDCADEEDTRRWSFIEWRRTAIACIFQWCEGSVEIQGSGLEADRATRHEPL